MSEPSPPHNVLTAIHSCFRLTICHDVVGDHLIRDALNTSASNTIRSRFNSLLVCTPLELENNRHCTLGRVSVLILKWPTRSSNDLQHRKTSDQDIAHKVVPPDEGRVCGRAQPGQN